MGPIWPSITNIPPSDWVRHGEALVSKLSAGAADMSELDESLAVRIFPVLILYRYWFSEKSKLISKINQKVVLNTTPG